MFRVPIIWLAVVLMSGSSTLASAPPAAQNSSSASVTRPPSPTQSPSYDSPYDAEAARELFDRANHARARAGAPPLEMNLDLTRAARAHAVEMAARQQLSHQFPGEPSLLTRLTKNSGLHLDAAAENVAYASTVEQLHDVLMHSPPHRENLLNPAYNVGGFSVVRSGSLLYVSEEFAHRRTR